MLELKKFSLKVRINGHDFDTFVLDFPFRSNSVLNSIIDLKSRNLETNFFTKIFCRDWWMCLKKSLSYSFEDANAY